MSNLVRQYYVVEQSSKARIINSNRKMELRLKELSEQNHKDDDGFVDGLVADIVEAESAISGISFSSAITVMCL